MHTQSSRIFRSECLKFPQHSMHLYARMVTTMYLTGRYGKRVKSHSHRLAVALEHMDH